MKIKLPFPPSVNHYWGSRVAGKRVMQYIAAKGKKFREDVLEAVSELDHETITDRLHVTVELYMPDRRRRDIDNYLKALLDSLMYAKLIEDDSQIDKLTVTRNEIIKNGYVVVTIQTIKE